MTILRSIPRVTGTQILSFGHYQPARIVTNEELSNRIDTTDEWIQSRVGIKERRIADEESTVDMAFAAAGKAIAGAGLSHTDIDLVIIATCSGETTIPNTATRVAARLGLTVPAFDINTACSGFCYGLASAQQAILTGTARHVLVVGVEKLSAWTDWTDRATCVIFADGAGAAVVGACPTEKIGPVVWGSDGDRAELIQVPHRNGYIQQEGLSVFRWATSAIAPLALKACEQAGIPLAELAAFIPHQANMRIIEAIAQKIGATNAVVARDIVTSGNTSAASIPLAFSKMLEAGQIPSGAPVLLFGFGAGLTYAGQVVLAP